MARTLIILTVAVLAFASVSTVCSATESLALKALDTSKTAAAANTAEASTKSDLLDAMAVKAVEELVGGPIKLMWDDIWDAMKTFVPGGLTKLRYFTTSAEPKKLAIFVMDQVKKSIFGGVVNEAMWHQSTVQLWKYLSDWYKTTPESPREVLELGIWLGLVKLYKEHMAPNMGGSSKLNAMNAIVFDKDMVLIKQWANEFKQKFPLVEPKEEEEADKKEEADKEEE